MWLLLGRAAQRAIVCHLSQPREQKRALRARLAGRSCPSSSCSQADCAVVSLQSLEAVSLQSLEVQLVRLRCHTASTYGQVLMAACAGRHAASTVQEATADWDHSSTQEQTMH